MKSVFLLFIALMFVSCRQTYGQKGPETITRYKAPGDWKVLKKDNWSIQYPPTWKEDKQDDDDTLGFSIVSSLDTSNDEPNINFELLGYDTIGITIDSISKVLVEQTKIDFENVKLVENKSIKVGVITYQEIIYTVDDSLNCQFEQWIGIINQKLYVFTFGALTQEFNNYKEVGENIMSTFTIKH